MLPCKAIHPPYITSSHCASTKIKFWKYPRHFRLKQRQGSLPFWCRGTRVDFGYNFWTSQQSQISQFSIWCIFLEACLRFYYVDINIDMFFWCWIKRCDPSLESHIIWFSPPGRCYFGRLRCIQTLYKSRTFPVTYSENGQIIASEDGSVTQPQLYYACSHGNCMH